MFDTEFFSFEQACNLTEDALEMMLDLLDAGFVEFGD